MVPAPELGGQAAHRQRLEALGVGEVDRGRGDLVAAEPWPSAAPAVPGPHLEGLEVRGQALERLDVLGAARS